MTFQSQPIISDTSWRRRASVVLGRQKLGPARKNTFAERTVFSIGAAAIDVAAMLVGALVAVVTYGQDRSGLSVNMTSAAIIAMLFVGISALRSEYSIWRFLSLKGHAERVLMAWLVAFGAALTLGFMTKESALFSRGTIAMFFVLGYGALLGARYLTARRMMAKARAGHLTSRLVMLVGSEEQIDPFLARHRPTQQGLAVVAAAVLRGPETLDDDLALAMATARIKRPEDIILLLPWSDETAIQACIGALRRLPATIHLAPAPFLDTLEDMRIDRLGSVSSIHLVRSPLSPFEVAAKRVFDVVAATGILAMLSPVLLAAAIAIKLETSGPVLFRQRRYGFNQEPFRILKFRSMRTMEDGAVVRQVTSGDPRVTRVGRILRRTSIDELPQLINVLKGDMSLVGPRPHAMAHDQRFERMIALYARRHNVQPGITGWAQVNGWRGETDTSEKIQGRVEHDLYYIDNWSFWFDISILLRTVFSPRTFKNAK